MRPGVTCASPPAAPTHVVARCACAAALALLVAALMWSVGKERLRRVVLSLLLRPMAMPRGVLSYLQERQRRVPAALSLWLVVRRQRVKPVRLNFVLV